MCLRSQLFYVFLTIFFVVASIVEASKKRKKDGGGKRGKKQKLLAPSTIPIDTLRSNEGTPIQGNSGPSLESGKAKKNKASVEEASSTVESSRSEVVSSAVSGGGTKSDDALGKEFRKAIDGGNFRWLNANLERWWERRDLLDDVITKGADVTVRFIQNVEVCKTSVYLLHSLIREKG